MRVRAVGPAASGKVSAVPASALEGWRRLGVLLQRRRVVPSFVGVLSDREGQALCPRPRKHREDGAGFRGAVRRGFGAAGPETCSRAPQLYVLRRLFTGEITQQGALPRSSFSNVVRLACRNTLAPAFKVGSASKLRAASHAHRR